MIRNSASYDNINYGLTPASIHTLAWGMDTLIQHGGQVDASARMCSGSMYELAF